MPAIRVQSIDRQAPTDSADEAYEDIANHAPVLWRLDLKWRRGSAKGRFSSAGWHWEVRQGAPEDRNPDRIFNAVLEQCEAMQDAHGGPCRFQTTCVIMEKGETEKKAPPVTFVLDPEATTDETAGLTSSLVRTVKEFQAVVSRQNSQIEKLTSSVVKMAQGYEALAGPSIAMAHLQWEKEKDAREHTSEEAESEREFELIRELGGKALLVAGAKEAAKNIPKGTPIWEVARDVAGTIIARPDVRAILGDDGSSLVLAIAQARSQGEAENAFAALRTLVKGGEIDLTSLLAAAPELMALAHLF